MRLKIKITTQELINSIKNAKLRILFFLFIFFAIYHGFSQNLQQKNFSNEILDSIIDSKKISKKNSYLKSVGEKLKLSEGGEILQVYVISKWILNYLHYDEVPTGANYLHSLKTRKAVCSQYAYFFDSISKYCGLEVSYISGYIKSAPNSTLELHAWNSVKLNNQYYLIDLTWCDEKENLNNSEFNTLYFLVEPCQFIKTHYPLKKEFKFTKYSKRKFKNSPNFLGGYYFLNNNFNHNLDNIFQKKVLNIEIILDSLKNHEVEIISFEIVLCNKEEVLDCDEILVMQRKINVDFGNLLIFSGQIKNKKNGIATLLVNYKIPNTNKIRGISVLEFSY